MNSSRLKTFGYLLRREFWENRGAFLTVPLGIGGFIVFVTLAFITATSTMIHEIDGEQFLLSKAVAAIKDIAPENLDALMDLNLLGSSVVFHMALIFVVFFYMLGSLCDDRRDRSILFWKSLPVSDTQTVLSKLVSGSLLAPALWVAAIAAMHVALLLIASVLFFFSDIPVYQYLWGPADPLSVWLFLLVSYFVQAFWMLPIWGWALLASAFARSKPFLWAVVPPVILVILQAWVSAIQFFRIDFSLGQVIANRIIGGVIPNSIQFDGSNVQIGNIEFSDSAVTETPIEWSTLLERFAQAEMWWGIAFGAACIFAAILIRRYRDET